MVFNINHTIKWKKTTKKKSAEQILKEIKRRTRRKFTAEEKIKIVLEGMRGEDTIAAICRKYAMHHNNYFKWSKEFIESGKRRLSGDIQYMIHLEIE